MLSTVEILEKARELTCARCLKLVRVGKRKEFTLCVDATWHSDETALIEKEQADA